jgi:hypothetical protein
MSDTKATLRVLALVIHVLAAITLVVLFFQTWGMTVFCVVAGALIGCASVPARPGQPITLYTAFGLLTGFAAWMCVNAVNQGVFWLLVPVLLLAIGAAWLLQDPGWPPVLFTTVLVLVGLALAVLQYRHRNDPSDYEPELLRRTALTSFVMLSLGLVYLVLGFAEASVRKSAKTTRGRRRALSQAAELD